MLDLSTVELDPAKLSKGCYWTVWREQNGALAGRPIAGPGDGVWLLIVPQGIAFDRALDEERRPHLESLRSGKGLSDAETAAIVNRAHGRATLKGWGGLVAHGEPIPFSEAKAIEFMTDDRWKAVRDFVVMASGHQAAAAKAEEEQAAGN